MQSGVIGLTRFLETYWSSDEVRVNAFAPSGEEINRRRVFGMALQLITARHDGDMK
tara:strand:+ start:232 stop:399 length:168 start_codon:yes stop_codon:yes gene_type:complete